MHVIQKIRILKTETNNVSEIVAKNEDEIVVLLENPEKIEFERLTMSYGTSSVTPPGDGRDVYEFIKTIPKVGETYTIIGLQDGEEVLKFEFEFNELTKENPKLKLVKGEEDLLEINVEDEVTKNLITVK